MDKSRKMFDDIDNDEQEIDLVPLLKALWNKAWLIIIIALLAGAAGFFVSKLFISPMYQSSFTVYVNNKSDSQSSSALSSSDTSAIRSLANTYAKIITSNSVLLEAGEAVGLDISYDALKSLVDAKADSTTGIITVNVLGVSPENALYLAQSISIVAENNISSIVDGSSMRVVDEPMLSENIHSPNYMKITIICAFLGALLVAAIIIIREVMDDTIKDEKSLEERFGVAILGSVPNADKAAKAGTKYGYGYGVQAKKGAAR